MAKRPSLLSAEESRAVTTALRILESSWRRCKSPALKSSTVARDYLRCRLGTLDREEFHACWLNASSRLLAVEMLFTGTLTQTTVYPREVVKSALRHNAAAVIVAHNHPSGDPSPSKQDVALTKALRAALGLIDVALLDHIIVTPATAYSFAESGHL